jgi:hypothetical protein
VAADLPVGEVADRGVQDQEAGVHDMHVDEAEQMDGAAEGAVVHDMLVEEVEHNMHTAADEAVLENH